MIHVYAVGIAMLGAILYPPVSWQEASAVLLYVGWHLLKAPGSRAN